jgi:uncharacterized membrane protein YjjP (DUF1212 family)
LKEDTKKTRGHHKKRKEAKEPDSEIEVKGPQDTSAKWKGPHKYTITIALIFVLGAVNVFAELKSGGFPQCSAAFMLCAITIALVAILAFQFTSKKEQ